MTDHQEFGTFIIASAGQASETNSLPANAEWTLTTRDDPSKRHWSDQHGRTSTTFHGVVDSERLEWLRASGDSIPSQQVIIQAADHTTASNVNSLMYGGILLGYPDLLDSPQPQEVYSLVEIPETTYSAENFVSQFQHYTSVAFGCQVATKAWANLSFIYAVEKYKCSLKLDWFTPHSSAPIYGQIFHNEYPDYAYHVRAAFAVVTGFSVIEELGLEVRSSSQNPRFIGPNKSRWNPVVRQDLESRLASKGVDFEEPYRWVVRGEPTEIEKEIKPELGVIAAYAQGKEVRDREMTLIDAIHQTSWLRNYITAHKFSELNKSVSPYDVFNVQSVARRLILSSLGLWGQP